MSFMDQARIMLPMSEKEVLAIEPNTRFTIWDGNKPVGEYLVHIFEMTDEIYYSIEEIIPHSENGIDLDWEERKTIFDGFCKENTEEIIRLIATGEDGTVKGKYIKVFSPSFPLPKSWNPKFLECHEMWMKDGEFQEKVLDVIGEVTYDEVMDAINKGKSITYRYINQEFYKGSWRNSGGRISYGQIFADGENLGWYVNHPKCTYKKLEDGRTIRIEKDVIDYDILNNAYKLGIHRTRGLFCWIKRAE